MDVSEEYNLEELSSISSNEYFLYSSNSMLLTSRDSILFVN